MPRSNRPRRRAHAEESEWDPERSLLGVRRTEVKRDGAWNVQPHAASAATKAYTCPGCSLEIAPATAHVVAWRADGIMGEADDLADRRHWHTHCWKVRS